LSLSDQTLHDFVLNLLNDEVARTAFSADPVTALADAGLHDISAQDVQEVIPLVVDYAPIDHLHNLDAALPGTPAESAIQQLQAVADVADAKITPAVDTTHISDLTSAAGLTETSSLGDVVTSTGASLEGVSSYTGLDTDTVSGNGGVTATLDGVSSHLVGESQFGDLTLGENASAEGFSTATKFASDLAGGQASLGGGLDGVASEFTGESALGDVTNQLDASTDGVHSANTLSNEYFTASDNIEAGLDGAKGALSGNSVLGNYAATAEASTSGVSTAGAMDAGPVKAAGALDASLTEGAHAEFTSETPVGGLATNMAGGLDGFSGSLELAGTDVSLQGGAEGGLNGLSIAGSEESPLGNYHLDLAGENAGASHSGSDFGMLNDLGSSLDADALEKGAASQAGTVASFVSDGGSVLAHGAETGAETLGGYLTGTPAAPAAEAVTGGADAIANKVAPGVDGLADHVANLPGAIPALPAALPQHLPVDLPQHLPAALPELPHLPVANPLPEVGHATHQVLDHVEHNPVTDAVSHSPVGQIAQDHHLQLPDVGQVADDALHLGQ
jgi:hypothetical protein